MLISEYTGSSFDTAEVCLPCRALGVRPRSAGSTCWSSKVRAAEATALSLPQMMHLYSKDSGTIENIVTRQKPYVYTACNKLLKAHDYTLKTD